MKPTDIIPTNLPSEEENEDDKTLHEGNPEVLNQILARRAAQIATPLEEEEQGEQIELVLFRIGKELYGLDVQSILDIHPCKRITPLPRVPTWIAGLTNVGGHILAVLNLRSFLGLGLPEDAERNAPADSFLIRISAKEMELALKVDEVLAIETLPTSKIQEKTDVTRNMPAEYVRGVYNHDSSVSSLVLILNLPSLLADPRLIIQEEIV
jgi:purine-binding chemotaxis protein CheW